MTPTYRQGQMWTEYAGADLFLVTTNSELARNGELIMGQGIALEARTRFPTLPGQAGALLTSLGLAGGLYGLLFPSGFRPLALFQTKYGWRERSSTDLIGYSVARLEGWITRFRQQEGRDPLVHLAFPGVGAGKLSPHQVQPLLDPLPPCVTIWSLPDD